MRVTQTLPTSMSRSQDRKAVLRAGSWWTRSHVQQHPSVSCVKPLAIVIRPGPGSESLSGLQTCLPATECHLGSYMYPDGAADVALVRR
jgi:hypothetical protein